MRIILILIIIHCSILIAMAQWFEQTLPVSGTINDIAFLNKDTGFVAMDNSNLLRTTNGGTNWEVIRNFRIRQFSIIDNTTTYASTPNGTTIYRTFDGGTNWDALGPVGSICYISFINRDTGWISSFGGIYKTTNGGVTAQLISTENNCCTKLMMLKNSYNGEYYGWSIQAFSGAFLKTTNSGVNWVNVILPNGGGNTNAIFFLNKDTGWCYYDYFLRPNEILMTQNGGLNWASQFIDNLDYFTSEIYFDNYRKGWAGRSGFKIYATSNSGIPWGIQNTPISWAGNLSIIDSLLAWAGAFGIVKTINGGGVITSIGIDSNNANIPTSFKLNQNYPNPFNPQTAITFSLSKNSVVSLSLYDITGKEILKLYDNANLNTGNYKAVIDFSKMNVSSGVYFYTLKVFDEKSKQVFNETKKIIYNK